MEKSVQNDFGSKSAREIEKTLQDWAMQGLITSKMLMGQDYKEINKKYTTGELFVTSIGHIDVSNQKVQHAFEELHDAKRIMTRREVMLKKNLTSEYQIQQAVKKGEIIRFDLLGKSAILYIE